MSEFQISSRTSETVGREFKLPDVDLDVQARVLV